MLTPCWKALFLRALCPISDQDAERLYVALLANVPEEGWPDRQSWRSYIATHAIDLTSPVAYWWWVYFVYREMAKRVGQPILSAQNIATQLDIAVPPKPAGSAESVLLEAFHAYIIARRGRPELLKVLVGAWPHRSPQWIEESDSQTDVAPSFWERDVDAYRRKCSHLKALRAAMSDRADCVVIYEADVSLHSNYADQLRKWMSQLPEDWQVLWIGDQQSSEIVPISEHIARPIGSCETHAYVLRGRDVVRRVFWYLAETNSAINESFSLWATMNFNTYLPVTALVRRSSSGNDASENIEKGRMDTSSASCRVYHGSNTVRMVDSVAGPVRITAIGGLTTPESFNAGILRIDNQFLIACRPRSGRGIGFALLDDRLNVLPGTAHELPYSRNEDPRLVRDVNGSVFMSTNYWESGYTDNRMELRRIEVYRAADHTRFGEVQHLGKFDTILDWLGYRRRTEKNWTPFLADNGEMRYVYSIRPHRVLSYDWLHRRVSLSSTVDWSLPSWWSSCWGDELRGSSPPLPCGDVWLSTWHTYMRDGYRTGFYTFRSDEPYKPTAITEPVLLPAFATNSNRAIIDRQNVVFINGLAERNGDLLLSGGDNDHSVIIAEISRSAVTQLLRPIDN